MLIGYARVSTQEQTLNLQLDALQQAGCTKIFTETASGVKTERKGLEEAVAYVREGDTLVVWRLDRLGRSLKHLIETITALQKRTIGFKSLTENIDTTTRTLRHMILDTGGQSIWAKNQLLKEVKRLLEWPETFLIPSVLPTFTAHIRKDSYDEVSTTSGGKLIFHIFGALAEFERDIIRERTQAGLQAARARGRNGGRPKSLTGKKVAMAQELYSNKQNAIADICKSLNISRATLYRYMKTGQDREP